MMLDRPASIRPYRTAVAWLLAAVCVLGAWTVPRALDAAEPTSYEGEVLLERMVTAYENAERLQADFFAESSLVAEGRASGTVFLTRPCCLRVAFQTPSPMVFLTDGEAQYEFFPKENKAYRYRADTGFRPADVYGMFLSMRQYMAYVRPAGVEDAGEGLRRIRLVPVESIPQVGQILVDIDESSALLRRAVVMDADGVELAHLKLENYRTVDAWPAGFFHPPSDARIFTPMKEKDFLNSDR